MHKVSRRDFVRVSALVGAAGIAAACGGVTPTSEPASAPATTAPEAGAQPTTPAGPPTRFSEAPMLAEMVSAGTLPPVEERLPEEPMVVAPYASIGKYGGVWRNGMVGKGQSGQWVHTIGYETLVRWTPEWDGVLPNLAKTVEVNEDGTEYVFTLRKGIKFSDGQPLTADDIMFWYEDILLNPELSPTVPAHLRRNDVPVVIEKIDDWTTKWTFEAPNGFLLLDLAKANNDPSCERPKHYMGQFHPKHNPDIDAVVEASGFANWADLFAYKAIDYQDPAIPVVKGWVVQNPLGEGTQVISIRNPYYWKVDPEGNQLPYIDQNTADYFTETEPLVLRAMNGEIDWQERFLTAPENKAVYYDNMERGGYEVRDLIPTMTNALNLCVNMLCSNPVKAEIFSNKDFRIGLSHALNRQEIIDVVYVGQSEPWQSAPRKESEFYHERLAKQYTEYDPDLANEYLDKTGWVDRDSEGYRLGPDGKRISILWEVDVDETTYPDVLELCGPMWKAVGIESNVKTMERTLWEERVRSTTLEYEASCHRYGGSVGLAVLLDARYYVPNNNGGSFYAKPWAWWWSDSTRADAVEPPEQVKQALDLYNQVLATPDAEKQHDLFMQILDIAADQFYCIGIGIEPPGYSIVSNRMRNTPPTMAQSWIYPTPAPYNPCQWWIEE